MDPRPLARLKARLEQVEEQLDELHHRRVALLQRLVDREYHFKDKEWVRDYFTRLTGLVKNLN